MLTGLGRLGIQMCRRVTLCIRPTADREDEHAVSVVETGPLPFIGGVFGRDRKTKTQQVPYCL